MTTQQKIGIALSSLAVVAAILLQKLGSMLFRPEHITDIQIVPAPADLTAPLILLSTNWMLLVPLILVFAGGIFCMVIPPMRQEDTPQLVEIKYVR